LIHGLGAQVRLAVIDSEIAIDAASIPYLPSHTGGARSLALQGEQSTAAQV
jgi:hypothetical protein